MTEDVIVRNIEKYIHKLERKSKDQNVERIKHEVIKRFAPAIYIDIFSLCTKTNFRYDVEHQCYCYPIFKDKYITFSYNRAYKTRAHLIVKELQKYYKYSNILFATTIIACIISVGVVVFSAYILKTNF